MSTEQMGTEQMGSQHEDTSIEAIFAQHADRTALRQRSGPDITDMGFRELWDRAGALAAALGETVSAGDRIAVLGTATADAVTLDLAAWILGAVSVPLQASAPVAALRAIVEETTPVGSRPPPTRPRRPGRSPRHRATASGRCGSTPTPTRTPTPTPP